MAFLLVVIVEEDANVIYPGGNVILWVQKTELTRSSSRVPDS